MAQQQQPIYRMIDETVNKPIHIKFPVLTEVAMAML